jgi:hypothetical protein
MVSTHQSDTDTDTDTIAVQVPNVEQPPAPGRRGDLRPRSQIPAHSPVNRKRRGQRSSPGSDGSLEPPHKIPNMAIHRGSAPVELERLNVDGIVADLHNETTGTTTPRQLPAVRSCELQPGAELGVGTVLRFLQMISEANIRVCHLGRLDIKNLDKLEDWPSQSLRQEVPQDQVYAVVNIPMEATPSNPGECIGHWVLYCYTKSTRRFTSFSSCGASAAFNSTIVKVGRKAIEAFTDSDRGEWEYEAPKPISYSGIHYDSGVFAIVNAFRAASGLRGSCNARLWRFLFRQFLEPHDETELQTLVQSLTLEQAVEQPHMSRLSPDYLTARATFNRSETLCNDIVHAEDLCFEIYSIASGHAKSLQYTLAATAQVKHYQSLMQQAEETFPTDPAGIHASFVAACAQVLQTVQLKPEATDAALEQAQRAKEDAYKLWKHASALHKLALQEQTRCKGELDVVREGDVSATHV